MCCNVNAISRRLHEWRVSAAFEVSSSLPLRGVFFPSKHRVADFISNSLTRWLWQVKSVFHSGLTFGEFYWNVCHLGKGRKEKIKRVTSCSCKIGWGFETGDRILEHLLWIQPERNFKSGFWDVDYAEGGPWHFALSSKSLAFLAWFMTRGVKIWKSHSAINTWRLVYRIFIAIYLKKMTKKIWEKQQFNLERDLYVQNGGVFVYLL